MSPRSRRLWTRLAALALILPAAALLVAVPCTRVFSIPEIDVGFAPEQYDKRSSKAQRQTAELYVAADAAVRLMERAPSSRPEPQEYQPEPSFYPWEPPRALNRREIAWVNDNEEAIRLAMEAAAHPLPLPQK